METWSAWQAHMKRKREKEERIASARAGREDRQFMAKSALKKKKVGSLPFEGSSLGSSSQHLPMCEDGVSEAGPRL